jgi:hypothetical protein
LRRNTLLSGGQSVTPINYYFNFSIASCASVCAEYRLLISTIAFVLLHRIVRPFGNDINNSEHGAMSISVTIIFACSFLFYYEHDVSPSVYKLAYVIVMVALICMVCTIFYIMYRIYSQLKLSSSLPNHLSLHEYEPIHNNDDITRLGAASSSHHQLPQQQQQEQAYQLVYKEHKENGYYQQSVLPDSPDSKRSTDGTDADMKMRLIQHNNNDDNIDDHCDTSGIVTHHKNSVNDITSLQGVASVGTIVGVGKDARVGLPRDIRTVLTESVNDAILLSRVWPNGVPSLWSSCRYNPRSCYICLAFVLCLGVPLSTMIIVFVIHSHSTHSRI